MTGAPLTGNEKPLFMDYYLVFTTFVVVALILNVVHNIQSKSTISKALFGLRKPASIAWLARHLLRVGWPGI